jgi:hypothetical protein
LNYLNAIRSLCVFSLNKGFNYEGEGGLKIKRMTSKNFDKYDPRGDMREGQERTH